MAEPYVGEVRFFAFPIVPKGWAACDGQLLAINQNQALFSILGITYGGDGKVNFALPNLQGRVPVHQGQSSAGAITLGESSGEVTHTLLSTEMPLHTHFLMCNDTPTAKTPAGNVWSGFNNLYSTATSNTVMAPAALTNAGGSQPHSNMQPYLVGSYCIALIGIFPSRN